MRYRLTLEFDTPVPLLEKNYPPGSIHEGVLEEQSKNLAAVCGSMSIDEDAVLASASLKVEKI